MKRARSLPKRLFLKTPTSNDGACAFREENEKETEHCIKWLSSRRSNAGSDGRNAIILPGPPQKSHSGAPASGVNAGRSLDCAPWAHCGERDRWDWIERRSGTPRLSTRNIWSSWDRRRKRRKIAIQLTALVIARLRFNQVFVVD